MHLLSLIRRNHRNMLHPECHKYVPPPCKRVEHQSRAEGIRRKLRMLASCQRLFFSLQTITVKRASMSFDLPQFSCIDFVSFSVREFASNASLAEHLERATSSGNSRKDLIHNVLVLLCTYFLF